ncbi:MAG: ribokinase [Pseudomonadota bacterium]
MLFNLGSINADHFYDVPHLPKPGETLAATRTETGLGGKGANQSVAAVRAGAAVRHIGAVGPDGDWAVQRLADMGVDVRHIRKSDEPTAHAIVMVDSEGENQIVLFPGANMDQSTEVISEALQMGSSGDWLLLQNETSHQTEAARLAREMGMGVAYSAAPFEVRAVQDVLPYVTLLVMNEIEAQQFEQATGEAVESLPIPYVLITRGKEGAVWFDNDKDKRLNVTAFSVDSIDTTGAGDTFAGFVVAGLALGLPVETVLRQASAAAALSTTKKGTADAIPNLATVLEYIASQDTNGAFVPQS